MSSKPAAIIVLMCPTCGKKYRGDANRPAAQYQCAVDKTALVRDVPGRAPAPQTTPEPVAQSVQNAAAPAPAAEAAASPPPEAKKESTQLHTKEDSEDGSAGRSWTENVSTTV